MRRFLFLSLLVYGSLSLSACGQSPTPPPATQTPVIITVVVTEPPTATSEPPTATFTPLPPTATPEPPTATATPMPTSTPILVTSVTVPANVIWFDTGIEVQAGQSLSFSASGSINLREGFPKITDPNGEGDPCVSYNYGDCLMNEAPYGTLIGKIGDNAPFIVGAYLETSGSVSGKLYLAVNDNTIYYDDNSGAYQVDITVTSPN